MNFYHLSNSCGNFSYMSCEKCDGTTAHNIYVSWITCTLSTVHACAFTHLQVLIHVHLNACPQPAFLSRWTSSITWDAPIQYSHLILALHGCLCWCFKFVHHPLAHFQDCGASWDWGQLAQVFAEACRNPSSNRLLLKEYADALLKAGDVVAAVDTFLHRLYWHGERQKSGTRMTASILK